MEGCRSNVLQRESLDLQKAKRNGIDFLVDDFQPNNTHIGLHFKNNNKKIKPHKCSYMVILFGYWILIGILNQTLTPGHWSVHCSRYTIGQIQGPCSVLCDSVTPIGSLGWSSILLLSIEKLHKVHLFGTHTQTYMNSLSFLGTSQKQRF